MNFFTFKKKKFTLVIFINGRTNKIFPILFWCCFWIRDPGYIKMRIRDEHPGSATLVVSP
jgi:hypothetical protein